MSSVNHSFFSSVDTERKAYWLGFLSTDGCVYKNRIVLCISPVDSAHLHKFLSDIESDSKVYLYDRTAQVSFPSHQMVSDLSKFGMVERKTFTIEPPKLPEDLMKHYWRGAFDGDGSIFVSDKRYCASFVGNYSMASGFRDMLHRVTDSTHKIQQHENVWISRVMGSYRAYAIIRYLYEGSSVYLDRKYELYSRIKDRMSKETGIRTSSFTTQELAGILNVTPAMVLYLRRNGRIKGEQIGNHWFINKDSANNLIEMRQKREAV